MSRRPTESFDDLPLRDLRRVMATRVSEVGRRREAGVVKDEEIGLLKAKIDEQAEETARLKNLPKRPKFKGRPSGMEQGTSGMKAGPKTAEGERIAAAMPVGIMGGFGPELRRFIAASHFQRQVTKDSDF